MKKRRVSRKYAYSEFARIIAFVENLLDEELEPEDLACAHYNIVTSILISVHLRIGKIKPRDVAWLSSTFSRLVEIQLNAAEGDADSHALLKGINKIAFPPEIVRNKKAGNPSFPALTRFLNDGTSSPQLKRAYEVRKIMSHISFVVRSRCDCGDSHSRREPVVQNKTLEAWSPCNCDNLRPGSKIDLRPQSITKRNQPRNKNPLRIEIETILRQMNGRSRKALTLEGLAKEVFLSRNTEVDASTLNRSIKHLRTAEDDESVASLDKMMLPILDGEPVAYRILD